MGWGKDQVPRFHRDGRRFEAAQPVRVLMVEDSEDDALLLLRELRGGRFAVTSQRVDTARDMQVAVQEGVWDLVTVDYLMPQFSGLAALSLLRETCLDIPTIMVSWLRVRWVRMLQWKP